MGQCTMGVDRGSGCQSGQRQHRRVHPSTWCFIRMLGRDKRRPFWQQCLPKADQLITTIHHNTIKSTAIVSRHNAHCWFWINQTTSRSDSSPTLFASLPLSLSFKPSSLDGPLPRNNLLYPSSFTRFTSPTRCYRRRLAPCAVLITFTNTLLFALTLVLRSTFCKK